MDVLGLTWAGSSLCFLGFQVLFKTGVKAQGKVYSCMNARQSFLKSTERSPKLTTKVRKIQKHTWHLMSVSVSTVELLHIELVF